MASLKFNVDKLDIGKMKKVPSGLSSLKSKVDKSDIGKLKVIPVDLSKLSDVAKLKLLKRLNIMLRPNMLKTKHLILLT